MIQVLRTKVCMNAPVQAPCAGRVRTVLHGLPTANIADVFYSSTNLSEERGFFWTHNGGMQGLPNGSIYNLAMIGLPLSSAPSLVPTMAVLWLFSDDALFHTLRSTLCRSTSPTGTAATCRDVTAQKVYSVASFGHPKIPGKNREETPETIGAAGNPF